MKDFPNLTTPTTGDFVIAVEDLGSGNFADRKIPWATLVSLLGGGGSGGIEYETDDTFLATTPDVGTVVLYYPPTDNEASLYVYTSNIGWAWVAGRRQELSTTIDNIGSRAIGEIVSNDSNSWIYDGTQWQRLGFGRIIYDSPDSITGSTTEQTLFNMTIPAGSLMPGEEFNIEWMAQVSNNTNSKTQRIRIGGSGTNGFSVASVATNASGSTIRNVGVGVYVRSSTQLECWTVGGGTFGVATATAPQLVTYNNANPLNIWFNVVLANAADSVTNRRAIVWSKS